MQKRCFFFFFLLSVTWETQITLWEIQNISKLQGLQKVIYLGGREGTKGTLGLPGGLLCSNVHSTSRAKQGFESLMGRWVERKRRHSKEGPLIDVMCVPGSWSQRPSVGVTVHSCHMVATNIPIVLFVRRASPGLGTWLSR